jgi:hypothetical protein
MAEVYEAICKQSGREDEARRARILKSLFFDDPPMTIAQICGIESLSRRTIYNIKDEACQQISALIFGVDSLDAKA